MRKIQSCQKSEKERVGLKELVTKPLKSGLPCGITSEDTMNELTRVLYEIQTIHRARHQGYLHAVGTPVEFIINW